MDNLIRMLKDAYFALVDGEDTGVDVDALIGNLGEFLALWDEDDSAFSCEEDKTPELVALVNKLKQVDSLDHCNHPMFSTPTTYEDLLDWCERCSGSEKIVALTAAHMALNFARHLLLQGK